MIVTALLSHRSILFGCASAALLFLFLLFAPLISVGQNNGSSTGTRVYWRNGLKVEDMQGVYSIGFGGRLMQDWALFYQDERSEELYGNIQAGTEIRRARFYNKGDLYDGSISYKLQFDFAGGEADLKDAYMAVPEIPIVGTFKVGHYKEPFGLEYLTSSKYITFMERSLTQAFVPGRNAGASFSNATSNKKLRWSAGIFKITDDFGTSSRLTDDQYDLVGRLSLTPIYKGDGRTLLHVGVAGRYQNPVKDEIAMGFGPAAHLADDFMRIEMDAVEENFYSAGELALVTGPFSFQGEFTMNNPTMSDGRKYTNMAYYVMASFFLTGEHRNYDLGDGAFGRVSPHQDFHPQKKGMGALELTARFASAGPDDGIAGGTDMWNATGGLTWHLNPVTRLMFNYVHSAPDGRGTADIFQSRVQIDF